MKTRENLLALFTIVALIFLPINLLFAIDFPTKPITIVVGFAPGGTQDVSVRAMADKFAKGLGVPVTILNKPGSGSLVGAEYAAKSKPDGYTIYVLGTPLLIRQTIDPKMPIDILKDFDPICTFVNTSMFITVKADSKFKTIDDLIDFALKNPGKLSCGSAGVGSVAHYCQEFLKINMKINSKHVPFTGEGTSVTALMGGHTDFLVAGWGVLSNKVTSGDLRVLASFDETRNPETKDVPTIKEKGFPEATISAYFSFVVPVGTPKEIIEKIDQAARPAIEDLEIVARLRKMGFNPIYKGPAELAKFFKSELEKYTKISKAAGITLQ